MLSPICYLNQGMPSERDTLVLVKSIYLLYAVLYNLKIGHIFLEATKLFIRWNIFILAWAFYFLDIYVQSRLFEPRNTIWKGNLSIGEIHLPTVLGILKTLYSDN